MKGKEPSLDIVKMIQIDFYLQKINQENALKYGPDLNKR